jgi:hypothetical protein
MNWGGKIACLYHCISTYPARIDELNLLGVQTLQREFPDIPIGYSGHEVGVATTVMAVVLGATSVERHITLDRAMWGSDQAASLESPGFTRLVRDIRVWEKGRGDGEIKVYERERPIEAKLRRKHTIWSNKNPSRFATLMHCRIYWNRESHSMEWKPMAKRVAYWTIPAGTLELARICMRRLRAFDRSMQVVLDQNEVFRNRHAGERCFILATGPSLREQDIALLQSEICFAVSNFFVHPDFAIIQPKYYCVAGYHEPIPEDGWIEWLREMESATGSATMFFSLNDRKGIKRNGLFSMRQVHYLQFGASWDEILSRGVDLTRPVPGPQSVPVMAIEIAIYMGFRHIYLLGCDHDSILHLNTSTHFYEESQHALTRAGFNEWWQDLGAEFESLSGLWRQYKSIQRLAIDRYIDIFNATEGGLLDVFPRVRYEEVVHSQEK